MKGQDHGQPEGEGGKSAPGHQAPHFALQK